MVEKRGFDISGWVAEQMWKFQGVILVLADLFQDRCVRMVLDGQPTRDIADMQQNVYFYSFGSFRASRDLVDLTFFPTRPLIRTRLPSLLAELLHTPKER